MVSLLATVAAATVALTLLGAAVGHVRRPGGLVGALRAHDVLPAGLAVPVAVAVVTVEAVLGLLVAGAVAGDTVAGGAVARPALAAACALFTGYAAYTGYVHRTRARGVPCGCGGADVPLTGWVVGRAAALAGVALLGWVIAPSALDLAVNADAVVALCAAGTFASLLAALPAAMGQSPAGPVGVLGGADRA